jgi:hypothetical protein
MDQEEEREQGDRRVDLSINNTSMPGNSLFL